MKTGLHGFKRCISVSITFITAIALFGILPHGAKAESDEAKTVTIVHSNSLNGYAFPCPT